MTTFSFRKIAHRCIVCVKQSNWVKMWFSRFRVLPGSAKAQVIWGAQQSVFWLPTLSVTFVPKNIKIRSLCQSYSKPKVLGRFLRHGVSLFILCRLRDTVTRLMSNRVYVTANNLQRSPYTVERDCRKLTHESNYRLKWHHHMLYLSRHWPRRG